MSKVVFSDLLIDDAPLEVVRYDASTGVLSVEIDADDEGRVCVEFHGVTRVHAQSMEDRRPLFVDGVYVKSVLMIDPPVGLPPEEAQPGTSSQKIRHFVVPSDDLVWQVTARHCEWRRLS